MRDRGYRRYREAQIKKRLLEEAVRRHNRYRYLLGASNEGVDQPRELSKGDPYFIRYALRNRGGGRANRYLCGFCERCVADRLQKNVKRLAAIEADWANWRAGDYEPVAEDTEEEEALSQ